MLLLVTPPERPRPALLASIGLHVMAASAFGFGPLLAFPEAPGWTGVVEVVWDLEWAPPLPSTPVEIRDRAPERRSPAVPAGPLPAAPQAGAVPPASSPVTQPGAIEDGLPTPPATEPSGALGVPGGDEFRTGSTGGGPGDPGTGTSDGPIDVRAGLPPDIVLPVALETPAPRYPDIARIARATGVVVLSATIAANGRVVEVEVEPGANPFLARAAEEAVTSWRYVPARIGDRRVAVILKVTLTFRLN